MVNVAYPVVEVKKSVKAVKSGKYAMKDASLDLNASKQTRVFLLKSDICNFTISTYQFRLTSASFSP